MIELVPILLYVLLIIIAVNNIRNNKCERKSLKLEEARIRTKMMEFDLKRKYQHEQISPAYKKFKRIMTPRSVKICVKL